MEKILENQTDKIGARITSGIIKKTKTPKKFAIYGNSKTIIDAFKGSVVIAHMGSKVIAHRGSIIVNLN